MSDDHKEKISFRSRLKVAGEVLLETTRKNIGMVLLIAGTFMVGYAVKGIGDASQWEEVQTNFTEMQRSMTAACDARLLQADKMASLRDSLVAEQTAHLAEQSDQLRSQGILIHMIFDKQAHNQKVMNTIQKAAADARTSAVIAARGATEKDREKINSAVSEQRSKKEHK